MCKIEIVACCVAVVAVVALGCWCVPEGLRRMEKVDCEKAREVCEKYESVHGGKCWECEEMARCEKKGII